MHRWKQHVSRHPIWGAVELTLAWHAVLLITEELLPPLRPAWFPDLGAVMVNVVCTAAALDDFFQIHSPGRAPDWWQVAVMVVNVGYGVWLIRRYGPKHSMRG